MAWDPISIMMIPKVQYIMNKFHGFYGTRMPEGCPQATEVEERDEDKVREQPKASPGTTMSICKWQEARKGTKHPDSAFVASAGSSTCASSPARS